MTDIARTTVTIAADATPASTFEARLRAEWPGQRYTSTGDFFEAPEVVEGGWVDTLIRFAAQLAEEVFLELPELSDDESDADGGEDGSSAPADQSGAAE